MENLYYLLEMLKKYNYIYLTKNTLFRNKKRTVIFTVLAAAWLLLSFLCIYLHNPILFSLLYILMWMYFCQYFKKLALDYRIYFQIYPGTMKLFSRENIGIRLMLVMNQLEQDAKLKKEFFTSALNECDIFLQTKSIFCNLNIFDNKSISLTMSIVASLLAYFIENNMTYKNILLIMAVLLLLLYFLLTITSIFESRYKKVAIIKTILMTIENLKIPI